MRNYVIVIFFIIGFVLVIICIGFIVDRLRRKRILYFRRRRNLRRLRRLRFFVVDEVFLIDELSLLLLFYELVSDSVCFDVIFI